MLKDTDISLNYPMDVKKTIANKLNLFVLLLLFTINLIIYFPSINGYFLADDFVHINYLTDVIHKQPFLLLSNFYMNWMQATVTQFYRPLITLTLAVDYWFWGTNAIGFHLSNFCLQVCCTILFYFLVRELFSDLPETQSKVMSTIAAVLFTAYPLHPEAVSWIIGRVDTVATALYLGSFLLFLKYNKAVNHNLKKQSLLLLASIICYLCSLMAKEIAVTLPLAILLWLCLLDRTEDELQNRLLLSIKKTFPYWIILALYLVIRTMALGTFVGGYSGSIGAGLSLNLANRLVDTSSIAKLLLPFNAELFSPHHFLRSILIVIYALASILLVFRYVNKNHYVIPRQLFLFGILWFVLSIAPTYSVFTITANLQGSRLIYLASAPLCFLLSLIFVPITKAQQLKTPQIKTKNNLVFTGISLLSSILCTVIVICFSFILYINNLPWRFASEELKALHGCLTDEREKSHFAQEIVLVNIPNTYCGAHMLYNGTITNLFYSFIPSGHRISSKIITLEPVLHGDNDLLNRARLNELVHSKNCLFFAWKRDLLEQHNILKAFFKLFMNGHSEIGQLVRMNMDSLTKLSPNSFIKIPQTPQTRKNNIDAYKLIAIPDLHVSTSGEQLLQLSIKLHPL